MLKRNTAMEVIFSEFSKKGEYCCFIVKTVKVA